MIFNEDRERELIHLLAHVRKLRPPKAAAILVKHLSYSPPQHPDPFRQRQIREFDIVPVVAAAKAVGLPIVEPLVNSLKTQDTLGRIHEQLEEADLLEQVTASLRFEQSKPHHPSVYQSLDVLITVYNQKEKGKGRELAKKRIELEIKNARGEQKARLKWVLTKFPKLPKQK